MTRTIRSFAAAALAGVVTFAAVPAAQAQEGTQETAQENTDAATALEHLPKVAVDADGGYYELIDGKYTKIDPVPAGVDKENAAVVERGNGKVTITFKDGREPITFDEPTVTATETPLTLTVEETTSTPAPAPSTTTVLDTTINATVTNTSTAAETKELSGGAIAGIAAAAAVPIVIAGVTYYLNQDGQTLVGSSDRVNQEPTAEEKAESDRLRAEHGDEIAAQQEAAAEASRGVAAETGSNTLARTLFALLIAVVLGSAAFVAGRRFLV